MPDGSALRGEYSGGLMYFLQRGISLEEALAAKLRRLASAHDDPLIRELAEGFLASQGI